MAQPSITNYFNTRKRGAIEDTKINRAKKVLLLDGDQPQLIKKNIEETLSLIESHKIKNNNSTDVKSLVNEVSKSIPVIPRKKVVSKSTRSKKIPMCNNLEQFFTNTGKNRILESSEQLTTNPQASLQNAPLEILTPTTPTKKSLLLTPTTPTKQQNAMDKVLPKGTQPSLSELKLKLTRSSRLAELKASISRFKQSEKQLECAEMKTKEVKESTILKNFNAIELEVNLSPQKPKTPQKEYLSPKKDTTTIRKNLMSSFSPSSKSTLSLSRDALEPIKQSLTLPYKYRTLAEIFRAIDTVCQILYNRKETITFKKLKPAVEEMLKRNLTEKHLGQIKCLYPESFELQWEKLREFGTGTRHEHWELVLIPQVDQQTMSSEILLERRRKLFKILIEKLKDYHQEFLMALDPPLEIPRHKITRWHPEFDIEKVPDVNSDSLPRPPQEEKLTTGLAVLEKARTMFSCNTRMERALDRLKESQEKGETQCAVEKVVEGSILKGIPKALLEKVRQRQAAKALETITRSTVKEKEVQLYTQLPEIARLARNLFVSEKKSVLPLELVIDKLCNSYRVFSVKNEMEVYLKTIAKEVNGWLTFCELRGGVYVKLSKNADLSLVTNKLRKLAEEKSNIS